MIDMIDIDFRTYLCLGGYSHKSKHTHKRTRRTRRTCCSAEIPMFCSPRARPLWPVVSWCQALRFPFRFPPRLGPHGVECRSHGTVAISCPEFSAGQSRLRQLTAGLNDLFFRKRLADAGYTQHFFLPSGLTKIYPLGAQICGTDVQFSERGQQHLSFLSSFVWHKRSLRNLATCQASVSRKIKKQEH